MQGSDYEVRFGGIARLFGLRGAERLRAARVMVVGVGGVGSWAAEGLARSGVGRIDLVDLDDVCVTNTNRQLHALDGAVGRPKISVMAERIARIAPECEVASIHDFLTADNVEALVTSEHDFVIDAIDGPKHKCPLIAWCVAAGVQVVVVGGAGGRRDPTAVRVEDLALTAGDRLLHRVRKQLRQKHGFSRRGRWGIPSVFSAEPPVYPTDDGEVCASRERGEQAASLRLDCASGYGTASFVTGAFGLAAAAVVVNAIAARAVRSE